MKCVKMNEKEDLIPWLQSNVIPEDLQRKNIKCYYTRLKSFVKDLYVLEKFFSRFNHPVQVKDFI